LENEPHKSASIESLANLGPEAQGDVDESLLVENLKLSPLDRLVAASEAVGQVEQLQRAMSLSTHA
jgi:hypothetical protein